MIVCANLGLGKYSCHSVYGVSLSIVGIVDDDWFYCHYEQAVLELHKTYKMWSIINDDSNSDDYDTSLNNAEK